VSYRDVQLDAGASTITLMRSLQLDLGAVAKGLAIDLAARELQPWQDFVIDAGGDLYLGGHRPDGEPWTVGIRHPVHEDAIIDEVPVADGAVCTSGDYERRTADRASHHIIDPRTGVSSTALSSATVTAASAFVADGLATAAFVLGPEAGLSFLEEQGVEGLLVTPALDRYTTPAWKGARTS
jgi:thiamine biosynthesis lipoprotein